MYDIEEKVVLENIEAQDPGAEITLKNVIKVARRILTSEENFTFHQMLTVWHESEVLTKAIAFVSKRYPLSVSDWIREITAA